MVQPQRKGYWFLAMFGFMLALSGVAAAEPISFEQAANVTGKGGIEIGADFNYSARSLERQGLGTTFNQTLWDVPVFVRAGISGLEGKVTLPFGSIRDNYNAFGVTDRAFSGLENIGLMAKLNFLQLDLLNAAVGLDTLFPTTDAQRYLHTGQNFTPFAAVDVDLKAIKVHGNLGYQYTGKYTTDTDPITGQTTSTLDVTPGNVTKWALGVELPVSEVFSLDAEFLGAKYGPIQFNGSDISNGPGTTKSFVPGIRFTALPLKAKLGLELPLESKSERPAIVPRGDWRVLGGVSLEFAAM